MYANSLNIVGDGGVFPPSSRDHRQWWFVTGIPEGVVIKYDNDDDGQCSILNSALLE